MSEMTPEEFEEFTDFMMEKAGLIHGWPFVDKKTLREVIQQTIVDTELLVSGAVPIERWREK